MSNYYVREGIDPNDPGNLLGIRSFLMQPRKFAEGSVLTEIRGVKALAQRDYFVGVGGGVDKRWGVDLALGLKSQDDLKRYLSMKAQSAFPHLRTELERGMTMSQIFDGHIQVISEELELDPDSIDMQINRGKWSKILRYRDPTTKRDRALTLSETRTLARQDPRFWNTSNGKAMGSGLSKVLLETFGKKAA
jgi:hypothetical protein